MRLYRIVLGGNSNSMKSEALPKLKQFLEQSGYYVVIVPESATVLLNEGVTPDKDFQLHVARKQRQAEDKATIEAWKEMTKNDREVVILLDRSFMCQRAYTQNDDEWVQILNKVFNTNLPSDSIFDNIANRYDAVIHLESNLKYAHVQEGRIESREEALAMEDKVKECNKLCPIFRFIPRQETPEEKQKLINTTCLELLNTL